MAYNYDIVSLSTTREYIQCHLHFKICGHTGLNTRQTLLMRYNVLFGKGSGNTEGRGDKWLPYVNVRLFKNCMYISLRVILISLNVYDSYQTLLITFEYTAFVSLNSSLFTYSLCLLRAPVINNEIKQTNQTQPRIFISKKRDIHKVSYFKYFRLLWALKRTKNSSWLLRSPYNGQPEPFVLP